MFLLAFKRQYCVSKKHFSITFKLRSIITLKYLWVFKHITFVCIVSNTKATALAFLVLRTLATLHLDNASTPTNVYLDLFHPKKTCSPFMLCIKPNKLMLLVSFCHLIMRVIYFLRQNLPTCFFC